MEIWQPCPEFPKYEVSDQGRVRTLAREAPCISRSGKHFIRQYPAKILKGSPHKQLGYPFVGLYRDGHSGPKTMFIHYLVCTAFHGPKPSPELTIAHGDGTRTNNREDNLRWATQSEQREDMRKHGTLMEGTKHPLAKLDPDKVREIRKSHPGLSYAKIGKQYGVSKRLIMKVVRREAWKSVL